MSGGVSEKENAVAVDLTEDSTLREIVREVHANSCDKGFWNGPDGTKFDPRDPIFCLSRLALIVSEAAEAMEEVRKEDPDWHGHVGEELADIVIRVADLAGGLGIPLGIAVAAKANRNRRRPHMHGKRA